MKINQLCKVFFFIITFMVLSQRGKSAHIIGGDMTYRCVEIDSINEISVFDIIVTMYRDSKGGGADFDDPARFGVYKGSGLNWEIVGSTIRIRPNEIQELNNVNNPCITIPPNVGVESGRYEFRVVLEWSNENYKIAYQRCCRNNTISNLLSPQSTGAVFEIDITPEAQRSCNNSPTFNSFPPIVLCAGEQVNIDISANDPEGDQILYEFCIPKSSGGQMPGTGCDAIIPDPPDCLPPFGNAVYLLPNYSLNSPLGPNANMNLDPNTGKISVIPNVLGQFVVGICVKEFRNGKIISQVTRDFQFNVASCINLVSADLQTTSAGTKSESEENILLIQSCFNKDIEFTNLSTSLVGAPSFLWEFNIDGDTLRDLNASPIITFPDIGVFEGALIVNPQEGVCSDTAKIKVTIYPELIADFTYDYDTCVAGPVEFYDNSSINGGNINEWRWFLTEKDSTLTQNPIFRFKEPGTKKVDLIIQDNNDCLDTISKQIQWLPVPDVLLVEPSEFEGCAPATIFFNNLSSPIDSTYQTNWTFGDGLTDSLLSPFHTYLEEGVYDVKLEIISPEGCEISREYPSLIDISPSPIANFGLTPTYTNILEPFVTLSDSSLYVKGRRWYIENDLFSFDVNPSYTFSDTGVYKITLIGYHEFGCIDSISKSIDIEPITTLHLPNAFTPNNDGLNDEFMPKGLFSGINNYQLSIWNRWGERIFETNDIEIGWNGEVNNRGKALPSGVYVFQISYKEPRGKLKTEKGHVTLVR